MATALDVITLAQAKDWLEVDFPDKDNDLERLIKAAIAWVEKYTCHLLYEREVTIPVTSSRTAIAFWPIKSGTLGMKDKDGNTVTTEISYGTLKTYICYGVFKSYSPGTNVVTGTMGYASVDDIPAPLLEAAYKLIVYLYENRSAYSTTLPLDVQVLINQFRRSPTLS